MRTSRIVVVAAVAAFAAACGENAQSAGNDAGDEAAGAAAANTECTPLETRPPMGAGQTPAFEGQTRTCAVASGVAFDVQVLATGLDYPWSVEPLPDGNLLVSERTGQMRLVSSVGEVGAPIRGVPPVDAAGQGGLLDIALSPSFPSDRTIFWSYAEPRDGGNATSVARGVLSADGASLAQVQVIFRSQPTYDGDKHYGSRVLFGPDGMLYITLGERSDTPMRRHAQALDNHLGKIMRIAPDGSVPADNPFVGQGGALPEIWSYGHRNIQAAAFNAAGQLWEIEHGTNGGDELNLVEKGGNYGWPVVAYGIEYAGGPIEGAMTQRTDGDFIQPVYYWDPVIAPSGAQFYSGDAFPAWQGSLFIGALKEMRLVRVVIENDRVTGEEHLLTDRGQRVRDVREGPDGALYLVTDQADGELWKIVPRE